MTYRGTIRDGVVVFPGTAPLPEGTEVEVLPVASANGGEPPRGSPEAIRRLKVEWAGDRDELDRLLAEVQAMRDADLVPLNAGNLLEER